MILQLAGARNVAAGLNGYRPVTAESMLAPDPAVLVSASHVVAAVPVEFPYTVAEVVELGLLP